MQGFESTIAEFPSAYDSLCADDKSLVSVKVLEPDEELPVNCVAAGRYYASLAAGIYRG
jgi:hypothetical protein